jgi:uncharacterized membrane protein YeaQ/YmgE (transglycosylase-associated protein family)
LGLTAPFRRALVQINAANEFNVLSEVAANQRRAQNCQCDKLRRADRNHPSDSLFRAPDRHLEFGTMTLILILLVGGIIGWLASILMRTDAQQGIFLNIVVGIVGALIAGVIITPLIGGAPITSGRFDILSLFASFLGAVILLAIVNLFRRGSIR